MERTWIRVGVPASVLVLAAALRLWGLGSPPELYWDEQYYVFDAEVYLGGGIGQPIEPAPSVKIADEGTWVHPPLGKWAIALLGVGPFGLEPFGWRFPSAIFGIAGVAILYLLALHLWRSVAWAALAAFLLAVDGLHIVQSRIAMLDIFLTTFVTAAALFVVLDRQRTGTPARSRWRRTEHMFGSPYRFWAGVMLGAAVATKWTGILALVFFGSLEAFWDLTGEHRRLSRVAGGARLAAAFLLVPVGVYLLSYGAFWYQHGVAIADFWELQARMLRYHLGHRRPQPESSRPWTWPLLLHPIRYFGSDTSNSVRRIVALGNPLFWWGFLALLPFSAARLIRKRDWTDALAFGSYGALFLPWLFVSRSQFIFYLLPAVPFMSLAVVATLRQMHERSRSLLSRSLAVGAAAAGVAFVPIWIDLRLGHDWVNALSWLPDWAR